jgi:hypothetical protein
VRENSLLKIGPALAFGELEKEVRKIPRQPDQDEWSSPKKVEAISKFPDMN